MRDASIKPIETRYSGHHFRSRLEARWAVYFDRLGIEWEYEKEGYALPSGNYLPDFWLPQVKMWAEVKPTEFTEGELQKCRELAEATGDEVLLLDGKPDRKSWWAILPVKIGVDTFEFHDYIIDNDYLDEGRFYNGCGPGYPDVERNFQSLSVDAAVEAANSARFEHGENPEYSKDEKELALLVKNKRKDWKRGKS